MDRIAVIPARAGSKRLPKKSIPTNDKAGMRGINQTFCKNQFPDSVIPRGIEFTDEVEAAKN